MLSYQHLYHAGNPADVHKHAALAWCLDYLTAKAKPLTYLETHAGRGLYDLTAPEAEKTGEAKAGVGRMEALFPATHPYRRALAAVRTAHGPASYPGSPLIAAQFQRPGDRMRLAELHPQEHAALRAALPGATIDRRDGAEMALAACPPDPRRGLMLIDPSWEVKEDYRTIPDLVQKLHRKWNVGVILLWYPLLAAAPHRAMVADLTAAIPEGLRHEVTFPPARPGHGMTGSGLFVVNPPWGLAEELARISAIFARA
jgi:23S rRNA (adenine2030-N6)-methyltransferase